MQLASDSTDAALEDMFAMVEVPYAMPFTSPQGESIVESGIARVGPRILGHNAAVAIVPGRESKPDFFGRPLLTEEQFRHIVYEISRDPKLLNRIKHGSISLDDLVQTILEQKIKWEKERCVFCPHNVERVTPLPRIYHQGLYTESGRQVISFPNKKPFMPGHLMTVFADHEYDLAQLSYTDLVNFFRSGRDLAEKFRSEGAIAIVDFMNYGSDAAASVIHPHAQRGKLIEGMESSYTQIRQALYFRSLNDDGYKLMDRMMDILRGEHSELFVFENAHILVYVPFAPIYSDQTEVIFKNASNILDFSQSDLEIAARSMLGVIHGLRIKRGVTDINLILYQSDFNHGNNGFRMRAVVAPRNKNKVGGLEAGQGVYVVPTFPEKTAEDLRNHYNNGEP